jgi:CubicO group peptidase (beta-lactamase class C family)
MKMVEKSTMIACILAGLASLTFAQSTGDDDLSAQVDEVARVQMREHNIPGVSLAVMRDGKIIKAAGYGLANVELNVPVTPQSLFHTESLAKAFTATAVMMLIEEGKIGLKTSIILDAMRMGRDWPLMPVSQKL